VPGHTAIPGNERADQEAKLAAEAAALHTQPQGPATLACTRRKVKEAAEARRQDYWTKSAPQRYRDFSVLAPRKPPDLHLPRYTLGKLYASRIGHGDFAAYHRRFNHEDAELHCSCGREKSAEHFYFCRTGRRAMKHAWGQTTLQEVLGTAKGAKALDRWLLETSFYKKICLPHPQRQNSVTAGQ
jgi:hypothetical protein